MNGAFCWWLLYWRYNNKYVLIQSTYRLIFSSFFFNSHAVLCRFFSILNSTTVICILHLFAIAQWKLYGRSFNGQFIFVHSNNAFCLPFCIRFENCKYYQIGTSKWMKLLFIATWLSSYLLSNYSMSKVNWDLCLYICVLYSFRFVLSFNLFVPAVIGSAATYKKTTNFVCAHVFQQMFLF